MIQISVLATSSYLDYVFQVEGESIVHRPEKVFEPKSVYIVIDKKLNLIWIWAGSNSRLFHRYIAANWAGRLKSQKEYYNFKYEMIKQGKEPEDFLILMDEISGDTNLLDYSGEARKQAHILTDDYTDSYNQQRKQHEMKSGKTDIKNIITEINRIRIHIKSSFEQIDQRLNEIEKIVLRKRGIKPDKF